MLINHFPIITTRRIVLLIVENNHNISMLLRFCPNEVGSKDSPHSKNLRLGSVIGRWDRRHRFSNCLSAETRESNSYFHFNLQGSQPQGLARAATVNRGLDVLNTPGGE
jgi:hypothetical protein